MLRPHVSLLPSALESVDLCLPHPLAPDDLRCLLEALAWCPRPDQIVLYTCDHEGDTDVDQAGWPAPDMARLRSLTKLALELHKFEPYTLTHAVDALAHLTGLVRLNFSCDASVAVPAALGQLKTLQALALGCASSPGVMEAGCFEVLSPASLKLVGCNMEHAEVLPDVTALPSLTSMHFCGRGPRTSDHQPGQLPQLQIIESETLAPLPGGACPWLSRLPADMGSLGSTLRHLSLSGQGLTLFPLALTQLVALEHLDLRENEFAELPAAITALSRLTELVVGRGDQVDPHEDGDPGPLVVRALDARALGDLSGFPALCRLHFGFCEVTLCDSILGAVRHASLASMSFGLSHPARGCAVVVLQLSRALKRLGRGSVLRSEGDAHAERHAVGLQSAQTLPAFSRFTAALQSYGE